MSLEPKKITELTEEQRLASLVALRGYKSYVALLSQGDTDAPTAVVLENTIGEIVWTRIGTGAYSAALDGAFLVNKTTVFTPSLEISGEVAIVAAYPVLNYIYLTSSVGGIYGDDLIVNASIEIRVYN